MLTPLRLDAQRTQLLVIDLQEKLLPLIKHRDRILARSVMLIDGAHLFGVPVIVTEQYPQGIGSTDSTVAASLKRGDAEVFHKTAFSSWGDDAVRGRLRDSDRDQIIVCGIETHVCVLQTTLDLLATDFGVWVCADAVAARTTLDHDIALERMARLGAAVTTVESVLFELCGQCDSERFREMLKLVKSNQSSAS